MPPDERKSTPESKAISISGDVVDSTVFIGDHNTVNQTIIQKFFNIFKSDSESMEHRNRRILLGHVENAWIKGVLDASLHGAALLDLGIKPDPEAVTKYPWAIKKESTDETLPAGTTMLEIFDSIGMGRSLLILGAPGSGKTTMLLELARQLIGRAREDVTQPIPMVFNLASWTEKLSLADWLAQELNNLYSVPRKTAPDWVKGNKLLLLLDGLDEVRLESRAKCVDAINGFRKEHGLTSLAVCSRSQDYADLNAKLSFEGAIEVQPLTQKQIAEFFNRFGDETAGIKQVLQKDSALREMAETPLFLSIMLLAFRNTPRKDLVAFRNFADQRQYLFDTYIERMLLRFTRIEVAPYTTQKIRKWLGWIAQSMIKQGQSVLLLEKMEQNWLSKRIKKKHNLVVGLSVGIFFGLSLGLTTWLLAGFSFVAAWIIMIAGIGIGCVGGIVDGKVGEVTGGIIGGIAGMVVIFLVVGEISSVILIGVLIGWQIGSLVGVLGSGKRENSILKFDDLIVTYPENNGLFDNLEKPTEVIKWSWTNTFAIALWGLILSPIYMTPYSVFDGIILLANFLIFGSLLKGELELEMRKVPNQGIRLSLRNSILLGGIGGLLGLIWALHYGFGISGFVYGVIYGLRYGLIFGGYAILSYFILRFFLYLNGDIPWRLIPFLDHCVDLIFLRRVGGGYIFVHRLLMEHFAEMYVETPTSKGN